MERRISDIDFTSLTHNKSFHPSPCAWEDEVLYFLMLDRFSDNNEKGYRDNNGKIVKSGATPKYTPKDRYNGVQTQADRENWQNSGEIFVGGNLKGLTSKIGYLKRLGITAIWVSPVFRQVPFSQTYHGYGIQNFLDVDPRFGNREDLIKMVKTAHDHGINVILDIILNHSGDVFAYLPQEFRCDIFNKDGLFVGKEACWQADGYRYHAQGFRDHYGHPAIPFGQVTDSSFPDCAIWPAEFQAPDTFSRRGLIRNYDYDPEYLEGDFCSLKDINLGSGPIDEYRPSPSLLHLCEVYKYWIALTDVDGFRVDTVKHMDKGAARIFSAAIHDFAESLGKENFYLIAEITGGRTNAFTTLEEVGMDAALGINDIPDKLEYLIKGFRNPEDYFNLFRNSLMVKKGSHVWFLDKVVTTFDDHDQVRKGQNKARFCHNEGPGQEENNRLLLAVLAFNATTMGIPCIYYGTEQGFDGHGNNDRYIREAMFGGEFGAFESRNRHFFNEDAVVYKELAKILEIRKKNIIIRRGRQYLRPISGNGVNFGLPRLVGDTIRSVVPWARIFNNEEVLLAVNTNPTHPLEAWVTVDNSLHQTGDKFKCIYSTSSDDINKTTTVEPRNGKSVKLKLPAAGFVIFQRN